MSLSGLLASGKLVLAFYYEDLTPTCSTRSLP
jgi:peroxiredoxin